MEGREERVLSGRSNDHSAETAPQRETPQAKISGKVKIEVLDEEEVEEEELPQPRFADIRVVGVGGGGCNAVHRMVTSGVKGVKYIAINTDAQALSMIKADKKIHIGKKTTRGLGTGNRHELAEQAAVESQDEIRKAIEGADMVFITAGMGGGTGTGASPVVAQIAKDELGILTIAIVTKPFSFEGNFRANLAEEGISRLKEHVDALIVIANDKLLEIDEDLTFEEAFKKADEVLKMGIQGVTDIIIRPGRINVDFADIQTVMKEAGTAWLGIGEASGETKAEEAAQMAITNPLVEYSIEGAKKLLVNITCSPKIKMREIYRAMETIKKLVDPDAQIIWGVVDDENVKDSMRITVIATGFSALPSVKYGYAAAQMEMDDSVQIDMSSIFSEDMPPSLISSRRKY